MEIVIGVIVGIVVLGLLLGSIGKSIGAPDPATMSEAAIYRRLGTENAWISSYLGQHLASQKSESLKRMYDEKNEYRKKLVAELNSRNTSHAPEVVNVAPTPTASTKKAAINAVAPHFDQSSEATASAARPVDAVPNEAGQSRDNIDCVTHVPFDPALLTMTAYQLGTLYFHALKEKSTFGLLTLGQFEVGDGLSEAWLDSYPSEKKISKADAAIALHEGQAYNERNRRRQLMQAHAKMTFDLGNLTSKTASEVESINREYFRELKLILHRDPGPAELSEIADLIRTEDEAGGGSGDNIPKPDRLGAAVKLDEGQISRASSEFPTPRDVGKILAMSVAESQKIGRNPKEIQFVSQANVDLSVYMMEMLLLHSSSAFYAAGELILDESPRSEVRAGFIDYCNDAANSTPQLTTLRSALQDRFPEYAAAIMADMSPSEPGELKFSMLGHVFAKFIAKSAGRTEPTESESILALSGFPESYWDGMYEGARQLFQQAKLRVL